jgi:pimeloyl-ACP methyl ester carboxylesterase
MQRELDIRQVLPAIQAPTLLIDGTEAFWPIESVRWAAERIPRARLVECPAKRRFPEEQAFSGRWTRRRSF